MKLDLFWVMAGVAAGAVIALLIVLAAKTF